jgi:hypothetical protein
MRIRLLCRSCAPWPSPWCAALSAPGGLIDGWMEAEQAGDVAFLGPWSDHNSVWSSARPKSFAFIIPTECQKMKTYVRFFLLFEYWWFLLPMAQSHVFFAFLEHHVY